MKPTAFLGVAIGCWRELGHAELLIAGAIAAIATLWLKLFLQLPGDPVPAHDRAERAAGRSRAFRRFLQSIDAKGWGGGNGAARAAEPAPAPAPAVATVKPPRPRSRFPLGFNVVSLRALITNFDIAMVFLVAACAIDLARPPFELGGWVMSARAVWLAFYAVVLPLDFLDYLRTYLMRGHFARETTRLATLADRYRNEPEAKVGDRPADSPTRS